MAWYDDVFDERYELFMMHLFTPERNRREVELIRTALQLRRGEEVLDLACGHGRHAIPLARHGFRVVGLDITERFLEAARRKAADLPLELVHGDIRELEFDSRFDAAYSFFTSFGFFDDQTNFEVLRGVARALKIGGRFLLDMPNREIYSGREPAHHEYSELDSGGHRAVMVSESYFDSLNSRVNATVKIFGRPEGPREMSFSVRLYTLPELKMLLRLCGLEVQKALGDSDGSEYSAHSSRLIVCAYKTGDV